MTMSDESDESDESSTSSDEGTLLVGPRASWSATPLASALCIVHCSVECIFSSPPLGVVSPLGVQYILSNVRSAM